MHLRSTTLYKTKDGRLRKFYGCANYPDCKATHGAHPDGRPLGIPANQETKAMRIKIHKICEQIWGDWTKISKRQKNAMYLWLKANAPKEHIAEMNMEELLATEKLLIQLTKNL